MTKRLPLLAALLTFAGSIAGFHLTTAVGEPGERWPGGSGSLAGVRPEGETGERWPGGPGSLAGVRPEGETRFPAEDCPRARRSWEEA
jgi:hypothetical protein